MRARQLLGLGGIASGLLTGALVDGCSGDPAGVMGSSQTLSIQLAPTNSGDQQTATVGSTLPEPLRVLVRRGSTPASGVEVTWSAAQGSLSAHRTTTDASGIATVVWTLDTLAGQQSAGASIPPDTVPSVAFGAVASPGPASRLAFRVQPAFGFADRPFPRVVEVAAVDHYGNTATDFRGTVTVTLGPSGSLAGTTSVPAVSGVATFADLRIDQAGTGYTLTANAAGLPPVTTAAFDVATLGPGRIAFTSNRDGCPRIYSMNPDGSSAVALTDCGTGGTGAAWSPDGTRVAFSSSGHLYVMNAVGSELREVRPADPTLLSLQQPAWSPDGMKLAASGVFQHYSCGRECTLQLDSRLLVMNADGNDVVSVIRGPTGYRAVYYQPAWSPNGEIAYAQGEIMVMYPDGTLGNLTNTPGSSDDGPAWSPDGTKIAFRSYRSGHPDLYVMNADGSGVTQLTADAATEGRPAWSPDGKMIAFGSTSDLVAWELYVMNADGSGVTQLTTNNGSVDPWPAWSP
jgi:TolB protein